MVSRACPGTPRAVREVMSRLSSVLALSLLATTATAGPITVGAGLGITQDEASSTQDPFSTLSLLGRLSLGHRLSAEVDITKVNTAQSYSARAVTGLAVLDLGSNVHWVPQLFVGLGVEGWDAGYGATTLAHHVEGGAGLEYRADGGFSIGARFHIGDREIDSEPKAVPLACCTDLWSPNTLHADQFRSFDLYAAIRL